MRRTCISAALVFRGALMLVSVAATTAGAAETHENCVTLDDNGNIIAATPSMR